MRQDRAADALLRLSALHPKRIDLGLARVLQLLEKLGNPQHNLPPIIHVAGTNGKGSVIAFLRAMGAAAGWRIHAYTSPHLVRFHERIRLNGRLIDDDALADLLDEVEARNAGAIATFFETTTAAAFLAFSRVEADMLLLETGLGGRADATNVITPRLSIITPIAHDHEHFLGDNITDIAREKAGIIKAGVATLSAPQTPEATRVLREKAAAVASPFYQLGAEIAFSKKADGGFTLQFGGEVLDAPPPSLFGAHQVENAALGAAALMLAFPEIPHQAIIDGIGAATWQARMGRLDKGALCAATGAPIWLDGAHNRHGAAALAASLRQLHPKGNRGKWILIAGMLNTRPPRDFLGELKPLIQHLITVPIPDQEASLTPEELAAAAKTLGINATSTDSIPAALDASKQHGTTMPIIIGGSLYLAGHVLTLNGTPPD